MNTDKNTNENIGRGVNRLHVKPVEFDFDGRDYFHSNIVGYRKIDNTPRSIADKRQAFPALPAGARLLDLFVCDAEGFNARYIDANNNGILNEAEDIELLRFRNAAGFAGKITPGLININNAPREVLRSPPNMHRFVHETDWDDAGVIMAYLQYQPPPNNVGQYSAGLTRLASAIEVYRDRLGDVPIVNRGHIDPQRALPMYSARGLHVDSNVEPIPDPQLNDSRGGRGFESIGEIGLLDRPGRIDPNLPIFNGLTAAPIQWNDSWRTSFGGMNPLRNLADTSINIDLDVSTDLQRQSVPDSGTGNFDDETSQDSEEVNMLLSGISNMITTRSDVFIVYFKIRSVKKDPATGIWDGTNLEQIVDDSRYVMVVDRSEVNRVTDEPRILLLEKLPN